MNNLTFSRLPCELDLVTIYSYSNLVAVHAMQCLFEFPAIFESGSGIEGI